MSDQNRNDENDILNITPILEEPPQADSPAASIESLMGDPDIAASLARLAVAEGLLALLCKDLSYVEFLREILLTVMKVIKCEAGTFFEIDHDAGCLFFRAVVGSSSDKLGTFTIPLGQGIVGHVVESRAPILMQNAAEDKVHLKIIDRAVEFETKNLIAVPLIVRGQVFGVLEIINRIGEESFTQDDLELMGHVSDMISKAIEVRMMLAWKSSASQAA